MVVVATHDSRMLPMADRVVDLMPDFAETDRLPETVQLEAGEVLFEQSTMGDLIYVVSEGEVEIVHELADGGEELLKVVGPGDYFGEIGRAVSSAAFGDGACPHRRDGHRLHGAGVP